VLAVISHLNEGNVEDAVALFADQFGFKLAAWGFSGSYPCLHCDQENCLRVNQSASLHTSRGN